MEGPVVDQFNKIILRLDQIQSQQGRFIERLDTTQNILQSNNKKFGLLEEKLSEITNLTQQEKVFMKDHLKTAQDEILGRLDSIQRQVDHLLPVSQSNLHQRTQSDNELTDVFNELSDKLCIIEDKTNLIQKETSEANQKCRDLETRLENKLTHFVDLQREQLTSALNKIQSIPEVVKGQTRAELVWLNNETNESLDKINTRISAKLEQLNKEMIAQTEQSGQIIDMHLKLQKQVTEMLGADKKEILEILCDQTQLLLNLGIKSEHMIQTISDTDRRIQTIENKTRDFTVKSVKEQEEHLEMLLLNLRKDYQTINEFITTWPANANTIKIEVQTLTKKLEKEMESCTEIINNTAVTIKDILKDHVTHSEALQEEHFRNYKADTDIIKSMITSLTENIDTNKKNTAALTANIDNMKTSLADGNKTINEQFTSLKQQHDQVTKTVNESTKNIKDHINKSKREIFAVIEKEAEIVRDRIEGPLPSHGNYMFHFYVENFRSLVRTADIGVSPPWHINEMKSCVSGYVKFETGGEMKISLLFGRHPLEMGLQEWASTKLNVKVAICDIKNKVLETINVGEETFDLNEAAMCSNGWWGCKMGMTSCDDLMQKGFGQKEGYWNGAILVKFEVTVL